MPEDMISENIQEVAEPVETTIEAAPQEVETGENEAEPAEQPKRDFEKDANAAKLRREAEVSRLKKEAETAKKEAEALKEQLKKHNFIGKDGFDLADQLEAQRTQKPIDEIRAERETRSRLEQLEAENKELKRQEDERVLKEDLTLLKGTYPDLKAQSVFDLGDDFIKLKAAGVDTIVAYEAVRAKQARETKAPPPSTGSVKSTVVADKEFFTSDELDRLTPHQLDDPKTLAKAIASMAKLKK